MYQQSYQQPFQENSYENYYNPSTSYLSNNFVAPPPPKHHYPSSVETKCKKACFPFIPKTSTPCSCNFNSYKSPNDQQNDMYNQSPMSRTLTSSDFDQSYDFLKGFLSPPYQAKPPQKPKETSVSDREKVQTTKKNKSLCTSFFTSHLYF